jgi:glycosyltransferase involved in cell wall biosynthesis
MCITALWIFARELHRRGIAVTVFALHYPYKSEPYSWNGIPVIPLNGRNRVLQRKVVIPVKLKRLFRQQHQAQPFTHIHTFWLGEATYWGIQLAKKRHLPVIANAMGQDVLAENKYLKRIDRQALKALITLSVFHHDQLVKTNHWSSMTIPFGLPEMKSVTTPKTMDVIGIGNLIPLKNYTYFIEICGQLARQSPDFKAEIIGVGPEHEQLQQQIETHGLSTHVTLTGSLSYEETQQRLAAAKLLLHPAVFESFGMIFIEALALQTHVAAHKVGMAYELSSVWELSGNADADSAMIAELLEAPLPDANVYAISATVDRYLEVYDN